MTQYPLITQMDMSGVNDRFVNMEQKMAYVLKVDGEESDLLLLQQSSKEKVDEEESVRSLPRQSTCDQFPCNSCLVSLSRFKGLKSAADQFHAIKGG